MKSIVFILLTACVAVACDKPEPVAAPTTTTAKREPVAETPDPADLEPTDAGRAIDTIDAQIEHYEGMAKKRKGWLDLAHVADLRLLRAQLSGDVGDYVAAGEALERAFAAAPEKSGPFEAKARWAVAVHDLDAAERALEDFDRRVIKKTLEEARVRALQGAIALQRGDTLRARELFAVDGEARVSAEQAARLGNLDLIERRFDAAAANFDQAIKASDEGHPRAWALLQRGDVEIQRGEPARAAEWFDRAEAEFGGWFLTDFYRARALSALGQFDRAVELLEGVAARTRAGQHWAALAEARAGAGDAKGAEAARARATEAFDRDLGRAETAMLGHALDFYLDHDTKRALELARRQHELMRSEKSRNTLAQALIAAGRREEADELLRTTD